MAGAARPYEFFENAAVSRKFVEIVPESREFEFFQPLLRYWEGRRGDRVAPRRDDIDPLDMPPALLPHVLLIEVGHDPLDFRYRLAGTAADTIHGLGLKGVRVLDLRPESFSQVLHDDLVRMTEDLAAQFVLHSFTNREGKTRHFHVLRLPLCDAAGRLGMVLVLADHGAAQR